MMVTPLRAQLAHHLPHVAAQLHVHAREGSSRNRMVGSCDSALAIITRRFMPPDSVMIFASFLSHSERSRSTFSMTAGSRGLPNRPRLNVSGVPHRLEHVGGELLRHEPDPGARRAEVAHDVVAVGRDRAGGRGDDAADDVDQRGLAGAVRAQQRENLAAADLEIDVLERVEAGGVGLGKTRNGEYGHGRVR